MKIISHRGNLHGPDQEKENKIHTIEKCLDLGFDVEVDIWFEKNKFYLGHDNPQDILDNKLFKNEKLWFHIKNIQALEAIKKEGPKNFFWHQDDFCALTSSGKFWLYPGVFIDSPDAIFVLPELSKSKIKFTNYNFYGICTDFVYNF